MKSISLKLIFRSWWRNKTFTVISVLSLAVGIACANLLAAFFIYEYNIEAENPNKDRMVVAKMSMVGDGMNTYHMMNHALISELISAVPELGALCRVFPYEEGVLYCEVGQHRFSDFTVVEADSTFLQFFPQKVVSGHPEDLLIGPDRILLTESFAKRLFGRSDPIGQIVRVQFGMNLSQSNEGLSIPFTVSAVVKDNLQTAFNFDLLFCGKPARGLNFFMIEHLSIPALQAKTDSLIIDRNGRELQFTLHSIREACFDSGSLPPPPLNKPNTGLLFIALLSAILILAIACFNYVNLSFSRVFKQLYSLHVQKLMGAESKQLSWQLFADTFLTVGFGFLMAQLIQFDLLGVVNRILSANVPVAFLYSSQVLPVTFFFILLLACIPAWYMSRRLPEMSVFMYNNFYRGKARRRIITVLTVAQFAISFVLIIGSFTVRQQLSLLYDKVEIYKNIYSFSVGDYQTQMFPLKERIAHLPGIQAMSVGSPLWYDLGALGEIVEGKYETFTLEEGDEGLIETMGYTLLQGLPWKEAIAQYSHPVYLNRSWARALFPDGETPVGQLLKEREPLLKDHEMISNELVIAGIVEDFFNPHKENMLEEPVYKGIISYAWDGICLKVRVDPRHTSVIRQIYEEWETLFPGAYLEHESLYDKALHNNKKLFELSGLLLMYSIISLLLTCFGLFGISLYAIEQRTKEIGIRKVNGSSTLQIMMMLNRQFIGWISIAYLVAVPVAWLLLHRWMQHFVYRADFSFWTYIWSLLIVMGITLLTVSWHSYRAASGNPVDTLRDE